jgi:hypothetical protein
MFHFDSLVLAPVQLGKHSCDIPSQFQSLGRLYVPLPSNCSGSVPPWGTFLLRPVSCCSVTNSFSLRHISRPIEETHDLLTVIALPGFQFAIQLECSFFLISSVYPPLFFDLINIDNSLLPAHPPGEFCWQLAASSTTGTVAITVQWGLIRLSAPKLLLSDAPVFYWG